MKYFERGWNGRKRVLSRGTGWSREVIGGGGGGVLGMRS